MTPGIQPSKVKIRLRKKLAIRPVMSTASGGKTTQKKYRSDFIPNSSFSPGSFASCLYSFLSAFLIDPCAVRNLRSRDSTVNRDKADEAAIQARRFALQYRTPCTCRFAH